MVGEAKRMSFNQILGVPTVLSGGIYYTSQFSPTQESLMEVVAKEGFRFQFTLSSTTHYILNKKITISNG